MKIVQCVHERKLKNIKCENRFEKSLLKYLHDKSVSRAFLITGKWEQKDISFPKVPDLRTVWMLSIISIRMPVATEI